MQKDTNWVFANKMSGRCQKPWENKLVCAQRTFLLPLTTDRMSHQPTNWVKVWGRSWLVAPSKIPSFNTFKREDIYFAYLFSIFASGEWTFFLSSCLHPHHKESARSQVFFTPGDFLLHPHIRDLEGSRREFRNPPRDLVNPHNKHASQHEILVSRFSA